MVIVVIKRHREVSCDIEFEIQGQGHPKIKYLK